MKTCNEVKSAISPKELTEMKTPEEILKELKHFLDPRVEELVNKATEEFYLSSKESGNNYIRFAIPSNNMDSDRYKIRVRLIREKLESLGFYTSTLKSCDWGDRYIIISVDPLNWFTRNLSWW